MNEKHIATNIGNAIHIGKRYQCPAMTGKQFRRVLRELKRHQIGLSEVVMSGCVEFKAKSK